MISEKLYNVVYADPPWSYDNKKTGGSMISGSMISGSINKYDVMATDDICSINIPADKNAVLFLWAVNPLLPDALKVMNAWGFKYKTTITWRKIMSLGMGFWWRGQTEFLLFGVKGKVKAFRMQEANIIQTKVLKHSEKPEEFRQLIERATPHLKNKLELFARKESEGWDVFGNEVNNSIKLKIA